MLFSVYNNGWRDANSLRAWALQHLPSKVIELDGKNFSTSILRDSQAWIVDFYGREITRTPAETIIAVFSSAVVWTLPSVRTHLRKYCSGR